MPFKVCKNKKGFTLVELIVVIAIMAILVSFATPNLIKAVSRREMTSAEYDAQHIYRLAISAIADLKFSRISPTATLNTFDADYAEAIVKKIYDSASVMDIGIKYYTGEDSVANIPSGYTPDVRSKMVNGGNVNPYIVVQVKNVDGIYVLIISYHNDKNPFTFDDTKAYNVDLDSVYKTNSSKPIVYSYTIRP